MKMLSSHYYIEYDDSVINSVQKVFRQQRLEKQDHILMFAYSHQLLYLTHLEDIK